jgi:phytoene dehydrogenase-like protein
LTALLGTAAVSACREKVPEPNFDGEFVPTAMADGHRLRDGQFKDSSAEPPERLGRTLILGAGIAGLSAGWELRRRGISDFTILEMEDELGGTSRSGASKVCEYPWGAHYLPSPPAKNADLVELLREAGSVEDFDAHGEPIYREDHLTAAPKERVYFRGSWHEGLFPRAGAKAADLEQFERFEHLMAEYSAKKMFSIPVIESPDTPEARALDEITMAEWLARNHFDSPMLRWWVELAARDDFGTELGQLSAWYGIHYFCSRGGAEFLTWPSGNGHLVHHLRGRIGEERLKSGMMVLQIREDRVLVFDRRAAKMRSFAAEQIIFALPSFLRSRLLKNHASWNPDYVPWMIANVHLSGRPGYLGFPTAWDNVIYGSNSLGYIVATHQLARERGPTVWTWYLPMAGADARAERKKLESLDHRAAASTVAAELAGCHRDLYRHLKRIDVMRFGHAMVRPAPGTAFSASRVAASSAVGNLHFAHTDLSGVALFEEAFFHGVRAAKEVATILSRAG